MCAELFLKLQWGTFDLCDCGTPLWTKRDVAFSDQQQIPASLKSENIIPTVIICYRIWNKKNKAVSSAWCRYLCLTLTPPRRESIPCRNSQSCHRCVFYLVSDREASLFISAHRNLLIVALNHFLMLLSSRLYVLVIWDNASDSEVELPPVTHTFNFLLCKCLTLTWILFHLTGVLLPKFAWKVFRSVESLKVCALCNAF